MASTAVRTHHTPTSTKAWDSGRALRRLPNNSGAAARRRLFAWIEDGARTERAGKFPHHDVTADGKVSAANLRACSSGIGILNGGRGGADISQAARRAVYKHLATHLRDAGKEPPDLRD
jgi:hypothetical protein